MTSLREVLAARLPPEDSAAAMAARFGLPSPYGIKDLAQAGESRTFHFTVTTPSGTALGGWIELTVEGNGRYTFSGHMRGSGFDPYEFRIQAILRGQNLVLALYKGGRVGGTVDGASRSFKWKEEGHSEALRALWYQVVNGTFEVSKAYENVGVLGTLEDIGKALLGYLVLQIPFGGQIAWALVIGSEATQLANLPVDQKALAIGILITGGAVLIFGPSFIVPAFIAGYAAGAQFEIRPLNEAEKALARSVFADSLPLERIYMTNLENTQAKLGRAFATHQYDGTTLINVGSRFNTMMDSLVNRSTFIHELVHAWQYEHSPVATGLASLENMLKSDEEKYASNLALRPWAELNIEAQADYVAAWYALFANDLNSPGALAHHLFYYISNHIRLGLP